MMPAKMLDMPTASAACSTEPTRISLIQAMKKVDTPRTSSATCQLHGWDGCTPSPEGSATDPWKSSLWVCSEKTKLRVYTTMSTAAMARLSAASLMMMWGGRRW